MTEIFPEKEWDSQKGYVENIFIPNNLFFSISRYKRDLTTSL